MAYGSYDDDRSGNYLLDHWRGALPLGQSYWINAGLIGMVVGTMGPAIARAVLTPDAPLRWASAIAIALIVLALALWIWGAVGVWRSSARHQGRGGMPVWAAFARAMILASLAGMLLNLPAMGLFLGETGRLAAGQDSLGAPITVRVAGAKAWITGPFALGSADRFNAVLAQADKTTPITTIYLASPGGRIGEAVQVGEAIKARHIDTIANGPCLSACTIAFVAGKHRSLLMTGRLGFHQPRYPGAGPAELNEMSKAQRNAFAAAGLAPSFIDMSLQAPPEKMWIPDESLLFSEGVVNTITRERVIEDVAQSARTIQQQLPKRLDQLTTIIAVSAFENTLDTTIRLDVDGRRVDVARLRAFMHNQDMGRMCSTAIGRQMIRAGAVYRRTIVDRTERTILVSVTLPCPGLS